jgi:hypothetical protein
MTTMSVRKLTTGPYSRPRATIQARVVHKIREITPCLVKWCYTMD